MPEHQRRLCKREQEYQGDDAPHLERDPGIGGGHAPHCLIQDRQEREEKTPAHRQGSPAGIRQFKRLGKNIFDEQAVEPEADQQHGAEKAIQHGRLHFDENIILQVKRQSTKHDHQHGGEQRHGRQALFDQPADQQRCQHRGHEGGSGTENAQMLEGREEDQQRAQVERQAADLRVHVFSPATATRAWAKSAATKGCKSSSPSPTPM